MQVADKERILAWRNADRVRANMYSDHLISRVEHDIWFSTAIDNPAARYLIFLHEERPIGFLSFTGISEQHGRCYWAFYLGEVDVPLGAGSAMEYFALEYAFNELKIRKLCCEVFAFNSPVVKLHERFGFRREGMFVKHYKKNDNYEDVVCLAHFAEDWNVDRLKIRERYFSKD